MDIICKNSRGQQLRFGRARPFWLNKTPAGLGSDFDVSTYSVHGMDGSLYTGAQAKERNIVLTVKLFKMDGYAVQKDRLYSFFQPRSEGTIIVQDDTIERQTAYYTESVEVSGGDADLVRTATISLICPDPLFYDTGDTLTQMASFDKLIEFDFSFEEDFAVEEKNQSLIKSIYNDSVRVGMVIRFSAAGTVVNPTLEDISRGISLTLETTMEPGDELTVDTGQNTVIRIRDGVGTNMINVFTWESDWLMLEPGDNLFKFSAEEGTDLLSVSIITRRGYWGA